MCFILFRIQMLLTHAVWLLPVVSDNVYFFVSLVYTKLPALSNTWNDGECVFLVTICKALHAILIGNIDLLLFREDQQNVPAMLVEYIIELRVLLMLADSIQMKASLWQCCFACGPVCCSIIRFYKEESPLEFCSVREESALEFCWESIARKLLSNPQGWLLHLTVGHGKCLWVSWPRHSCCRDGAVAGDG